MDETETRADEAWVVGSEGPGEAPPFRSAGDPLWRRAPLLLRRFPGVLIAILLTSVLLAVASAAGPLFVASASAAALDQELERVSQQQAGLTVIAFGSASGADIAARDTLLTERAGRVPGLDPRVFSAIGSAGVVTSAEPGHRRGAVDGRLAFRTAFRDHIEVLQEVGGSGVWISDAMAEEGGLEISDPIRIALRGSVVRTGVKGIYRSLAGDTEQGLPPLDDYWVPLSEFVRRPPPHPPPPPLVLADLPVLSTLGTQLDDEFRQQWEFPLARGRLTLDRAEEISTGLVRMQNELDDPRTDLGSALAFATETTQLPEIVLRARQATAGLRGPVETVAWAGRLVALAAVTAVGVYAVQRRRGETRLLGARGVAPWATGLRFAVESVLPVAGASVAGWWLASLLVSTLGPTDLLDAAAGRSAGLAAALTGGLALLLIAVAVGAVSRRQLETGTPRFRDALARIPWEAVALALAGASYLEIATRGSAVVASGDGVPDVDVLVLLFPILLVAGGAGVIGKGLRRTVPLLRSRGAGLPPGPYLAARRLSGLSGSVLTLLTACALAFGVLLYSGILVTTTRASTEAKAKVFTGSDVAAVLPPNPEPVQGLSAPSTLVTRIRLAHLEPGGRPVDVVGIDRESFAGAAFWDPSFGAPTAGDAIAPLGGAAPLRVLVAGGSLPPGADLDVEGARVDIRPVGSLVAFPGMSSALGLLVADEEALRAALETADRPLAGISHETVLWARGDPTGITRELRDSGIPFEQILTAREIQQVPSFLSVSWTFEFLLALGVLTGLVALAGIVLYLQARQRSRTVAYALARRMGLSRGAHRRSVVLELVGMVGTALLLGAGLAWLASRLVIARLDLMPEIPPAPVLRFPLPLLLLTAAATTVVAWIGAWWVQRDADRANVAEVLRVDA